jgi:hypothetical protein
MNDICGIALYPFVPAVVFEVQCSCNVSLDEECADASSVSISPSSFGFKAYGSNTIATVPAIRAAIIGMIILGWLITQSLI